MLHVFLENKSGTERLEEFELEDDKTFEKKLEERITKFCSENDYPKENISWYYEDDDEYYENRD